MKIGKADLTIYKIKIMGKNSKLDELSKQFFRLEIFFLPKLLMFCSLRNFSSLISCGKFLKEFFFKFLPEHKLHM